MTGPVVARDVVAFGHEIGRVLSDGRIIGRAEPYAKVFPSSREVKRAVGVIAWAVLEDIALDARIDAQGRLVATTNVRQIAANLGISKNAVTTHLGRLREHGFVLHEEQRHLASGRYLSSWYVLDPSACIERFTTTPVSEGPAGGSSEGVVEPCPSSWDTGASGSVDDPCPMSGATAVSGPVSHVTGHREMGQYIRHVVQEEQQQAVVDAVDDRGEGSAVPVAPDDGPPDGAELAVVEADVAIEGHREAELLDRVVAVGVDPAVADRLLTDHGRDRLEAGLAALPWHRVRNPAGWLVRAVTQDWYLAPQPTSQITSRPAQPYHRSAEPEDLGHQAWAAFAATALSPADLATAVERVTVPVEGVGRRSLPMVVAQIGAWAAHAFAGTPGVAPLGEELADQLIGAEPVYCDGPLDCVELPSVPAAEDWRTRLRRAMAAVTT